MKSKSEIYLLSTVVAPTFKSGLLKMETISQEELINCLRAIKPGNNLCGHPVTSNLLKQLAPGLPEPVRGFWSGNGMGLAVRPRNGIRAAASNGDTQLTDLSELEWVSVTFRSKD